MADTPPPPATPSPLPSPPAAVTSPSPVPTLMPLTYVVTPPAPAGGGPAITQIAMSDRVVRSGAPYLVLVNTTADVTGVTVEAFGTRFSLFPAGPARFGVTGTIPTIPWMIADRPVTVHLIATAADGRTYTSSLELRVAR
jgi:hypothetical protein